MKHALRSYLMLASHVDGWNFTHSRALQSCFSSFSFSDFSLLPHLKFNFTFSADEGNQKLLPISVPHYSGTISILFIWSAFVVFWCFCRLVLPLMSYIVFLDRCILGQLNTHVHMHPLFVIKWLTIQTDISFIHSFVISQEIGWGQWLSEKDDIGTNLLSKMNEWMNKSKQF